MKKAALFGIIIASLISTLLAHLTGSEFAAQLLAVGSLFAAFAAAESSSSEEGSMFTATAIWTMWAFVTGFTFHSGHGVCGALSAFLSVALTVALLEEAVKRGVRVSTQSTLADEVSRAA